MAQAGPGKVRMWNDFCGPEIPVATNVAYGTTAGGCNYYLGDFSVKGELEQTDIGIVALGVVSGAVRVGEADGNGKGVALVSELVFSPTLQGPVILEARVQMQALTTRSIFVGFCGTIADDIAEPLTTSTTTHTLTAADLCGFVFDSQASASTAWHACYNGGTRTGETVSANTTTGIIAVAGEWDILRVEMYADATAKYWINGVLESEVATAIDPDILQGAIVGAWATASVDSDIDVDYILVDANRDWTR